MDQVCADGLNVVQMQSEFGLPWAMIMTTRQDHGLEFTLDSETKV